MHSFFSRLNQGSSTLFPFVAALLALTAFSSFIFTSSPKGDIEIASVKISPAGSPRSSKEMAFVNFNISADLSPLFNWNTKQVFAILQAEYTNTQGTRNEVIIWDRVIRRKEDADIRVVGKNKYKFREHSGTFKNVASAHYVLKYNVMPYVGLLTYGEAARTMEPVTFPIRV